MTMMNIQEHDIDEKELFNSPNDKEFVNIASQCEAGRGHVLRVKRRKLAIVFVPGIMASRLVNEDQMIWDPDSLTVMAKFLTAGPQKRQKILLKQPLSPPEKTPGTKHRGDVPKRFPHALERGWHTVSWTYYGKLLERLEDWATPLKAFIDMRVYAFGYDWLQSNSISGKNLCGMLNSLNTEAAEAHEEIKVILVSHSMGGLVTRACLNMLEDKNLVLGVIHGAQPAMGAPAAYRRQKAGFEAHSFAEKVSSLALGKDGPNVRAIFPYRPGPLELLPCKQYYDPELEAGTWFSYDTFENGIIVSKSVPSAEIYTEVYTKFDDECYYGMLNRKEFYQGLEFLFENEKSPPQYNLNDEDDIYSIPDGISHDDTEVNTVNGILDAALFHDKLHEGGIHQRTIQLLSRGNPTCCAVHWKIIDLTDDILNCKFTPHTSSRGFSIKNPDISIIKVLPREELGKNCYYEVRWIEKDWSVGECITTSSKNFENTLGRDIKEEIKKTGRRVVLFTLTGPAQDGNPDQKHSHWSMDGDGTVPVASVIALPTSIEGWPPALKNLLPTYDSEAQTATSGVGNTPDVKEVSRHADQTAGKHGGKPHSATRLANNAEHSKFFDDAAIRLTKQAIHNLCLAWLKGDIA